MKDYSVGPDARQWAIYGGFKPQPSLLMLRHPLAGHALSRLRAMQIAAREEPEAFRRYQSA